MEFICQKQPLKELKMLSITDKHSILIDGPSGSGKTYLCMQYANLLNVGDIQYINPKVDEIKAAIEACLQINSPVVLCIENLDIGVPAASYALLKFLEEPNPNVYIIVTCRNIKNVPDTIISRSVVVSVNCPVDADITEYAVDKNPGKYAQVKDTSIWKCVRTFRDVDTVLAMSFDQLNYFESLKTISKFQDTVSNLVWKLSHYDDNSECPVDLVIRYMMQIIPTAHSRSCGVACLNALDLRRIASHAVLARYVFDMKYCE